MSVFDPHTALYSLLNEYSARAHAIRQDLARSHSPDFASRLCSGRTMKCLKPCWPKLRAACARLAWPNCAWLRVATVCACAVVKPSVRGACRPCLLPNIA